MAIEPPPLPPLPTAAAMRRVARLLCSHVLSHGCRCRRRSSSDDAHQKIGSRDQQSKEAALMSDVDQ